MLRVTDTQTPNTHPNPPTLPNRPFHRRRRLTISPAQAAATPIMPSRSQTISGPFSNVTPLPADSSLVFELNQARRAKVTKEVETLRSGTCLSQKFGMDFRKTLSHTLIHNRLNPAVFLEWPTVEGFEAFVEKRVEYGEMMEDHVADLRAVVREQLVIAEGLERAVDLAEDRRLQEFQRALERMDPVEAEAAQRAERERASRLQREYVARLAELDAEFARIKARVRAEDPYDN
jgi:hypothetical protein